MAVTYTPLKSDYGFQSPNFSVDLVGNILATAITIDSINMTTPEFNIENFVFLDSTIDTQDSGTIQFLNDSVEFNSITSTDITVTDLTSTTLTTDDLITTNNIVSTGISSITTIDIDAVTRVSIKNSPLQLESFTTLERTALTPLVGDSIFNSTDNVINVYNGTTWTNASTGNLLISNTTITSSLNADIIFNTQGTGTVVVNDVEINNSPVNNNQATRKDYVDRRITAFAIAFGA